MSDKKGMYIVNLRSYSFVAAIFSVSRPWQIVYIYLIFTVKFIKLTLESFVVLCNLFFL